MRLATRLSVLLGLCASMALTGGCMFLANFFTPSNVMVELVNTGDFPVEVTVRIGEDQNVLEEILESTGTELNFTLDPNSTETFSRGCEQLQAILIEDADVQVIGSIGPSQNTGVFRDGDDFNCGDTLTFRFVYPDVPTSLDIEFSSSAGGF